MITTYWHKCMTCKIREETEKTKEPSLCGWYLENVVCGDNTADNCPNYSPREIVNTELLGFDKRKHNCLFCRTRKEHTKYKVRFNGRTIYVCNRCLAIHILPLKTTQN